MTPVQASQPSGQVPLALGAADQSFDGYAIFKPAGGPSITKVKFTGTTPKPTVTIKGHGFGSEPKGSPDNTTGCGPYAKNGDDFGPSNLWFEDVNKFVAGQGTPPTGACIGIIVTTWTANEVVLHFGSAYDTVDDWNITAGDTYVLSVKGDQASGPVSFS